MKSEPRKVPTKAALEAWRPWFAWYPVTVPIDEGNYCIVWLEWVERRTQYLNIPDYGPLPTEYRMPRTT